MSKKIHQVWVQGIDNFRHKEETLYHYSQQWQRYFPDYEYKLWGEEDYLPLIKKYSEQLLAVYNHTPNYACKSDIARYVILLQGGLYVDTDFETFKRHDYLFNDPNLELVVVRMALCKSKCYFSGYKYSNAWLYAKPNCKYIIAMLDWIICHPYVTIKEVVAIPEVKRIIYYPLYSAVEYTWKITGPAGLTKILEKEKITSDSNVRILPHCMIEVADFSNVTLLTQNEATILKQYPYAVAIHRMKASWVPGASFYKRLGLIYAFYNDYSDFFIILALAIIFFQFILLLR